MGRRVRIPFVADLFRTDVADEIRAVAADDKFDRDFKGGGPLLNRLVIRNIRRVLSLDERPLPAVAPQADAERARAQRELEAKLDAAALAGAFDGDSVTRLAKAVRGLDGAPALEVAVQEAVGRAFAFDYRASAESWAAAKLLDRAARTLNPAASLWLRLTGQIRRAKARLSELAHGDRAGVHATAIAVHNLVRGFAEMRELVAEPGAADLTDDKLMARCLFAPERVLRQSRSGARDFKGERLGPDTLVLLELRAAQRLKPDAQIAFMAGSWSQCPAAIWTPALIRAVFRRAIALEAPKAAPVGATFRLAPMRARAASALSLYRVVLGSDLLLRAAFAALLLAWPRLFAASFGASLSSLRLWGVVLLVLAGVYGIGWRDPMRARLPNVVGLAGRFASALVYCGFSGMFFVPAIVDALFGGGLAWLYFRAIRAELMTRP